MKERGWQGLQRPWRGKHLRMDRCVLCGCGFELPCGLVDIEQNVETIAKMLKDADSQVVFASAAVASSSRRKPQCLNFPGGIRGIYGISFGSF